MNLLTWRVDETKSLVLAGLKFHMLAWSNDVRCRLQFNVCLLISVDAHTKQRAKVIPVQRDLPTEC